MSQPAVTHSRDTENQHKDANFGTAQRATNVAWRGYIDMSEETEEEYEERQKQT